MGYEGEWEEFVERLVRDLAPALKRKLYMAQLDKLRGLEPPSDKLVYHYLVVAEPQPFVGVWRSLGIGVKTVDRALRRLREGGYVVQGKSRHLGRCDSGLGLDSSKKYLWIQYN